ncbi:calcium-binding and spermatid-specific protein 1 [Ctenodactylus gundi]
MAEDQLPNICSPPPTESSKIPKEAAIFLGADSTTPRPETTITSEGDHVNSVNDQRLESDLSTAIGNKLASTMEKLKSEDGAETHIKSTVHLEKELTTLTGTTNFISKEYNTENFITKNIGNISPPVATVSLIDFPTHMTKEDILLPTIDTGEEGITKPTEVPITLENDPISSVEEGEPDIDSNNSPVNPRVPADGAGELTDSFIPEDEISPSAKNNFTIIPDITALVDENINEADLVVSEDDPKAVTKLSDSDVEKLITVFELTTSAEDDKDNSGDTLSDEESTEEIRVWMERNRVNKAGTHSVLLTAAESRYDFIIPRSAAMDFMDASAASSTEDLSENNSSEPVTKGTEPCPDTLSNNEDTSTAEMGIFKLLKEDPDEFMI